MKPQQGKDIRIGTLIEVHGPVVKIACEILPSMHQALKVYRNEDIYILEVYQHI